MFYLVRATVDLDRASELHRMLRNGELDTKQPFGRALTRGLRDARFDESTGEAVWLEEDTHSPPLSPSQTELLERFFTDITDERVTRTEGRKRLEGLPPLWDEVLE